MFDQLQMKLICDALKEQYKFIQIIHDNTKTLETKIISLNERIQTIESALVNQGILVKLEDIKQQEKIN
jgi:hypothetical protein